MKTYRVGVIGATGNVGQTFIHLLKDHPWFKISFLAASEESENYTKAVQKRGWNVSQDVPKNVVDMKVHEARNVSAASELCDLVFSALDSGPAKELEPAYAKIMPVVSNASAFRWDPLVPMVIPEINPHHLEIIPEQQKKYDRKGFLVVKPNCSLQSYVQLLYPLIKSGYRVSEVKVTTLQAASGAGRPGVPSLDLIDNWVPYIGGEEEKTEKEPLKILGKIVYGEFKLYDELHISATCIRVPVSDGHGASVFMRFARPIPSIEETIALWENFRGMPQELKLPSAPENPIIYRHEDNRPQPKLDRDACNGMALTAARLRKDDNGLKVVGLSHNLVRGAAGGAILTAELLAAKGYLD